jgi:hypothetical protein
MSYHSQAPFNPPSIFHQDSGATSVLSWGLKGLLHFSAICSVTEKQVFFLCAYLEKVSPLHKPNFQPEAPLDNQFSERKLVLSSQVDTAPSQGTQLSDLTTGWVLTSIYSFCSS